MIRRKPMREQFKTLADLCRPFLAAGILWATFSGCQELPKQALIGQAAIVARSAAPEPDHAAPALPAASSPAASHSSAPSQKSSRTKPRQEIVRVAANDDEPSDGNPDNSEQGDAELADLKLADEEAIDKYPTFRSSRESWFPGQMISRRHVSLAAEPMYGPAFARGYGSPIDEEHLMFSSDADNGSGSLMTATGDETQPGVFDPTLSATDEAPFELADGEIISFKEDMKQLPSMLWNDNLSLFTLSNAIILGTAAGGSVAIRDNLDQRVRAETAEHPLRWGQGSVVLRQFGEFTLQVPTLAGIYALSLWVGDEYCLHEFSKAAISAYSISAMYTVAIKGITNTQRPTTQFEHGHYGFPSYHASSTFCIAGVIDEYYGWKAGVPAYVMAGLVSWSRIDQREHDLSDVVFGAVLGVVIGKTIAAAHLERYSNLRVTPYYDPNNNATGVSAEVRY